jgi:uncharacterized membrane protein YhaH (DUF805 family)
VAARDPRETGGADRALLWLLGGLAVLVLAVFALFPELVQAGSGAVSQLALVVIAAGIPGLVIIAAVAVRRRRASDRREDHP